MAAASELSNKLATRLLDLVALIGLSITQKPLHKAKWEVFEETGPPPRRGSLRRGFTRDLMNT